MANSDTKYLVFAVQTNRKTEYIQGYSFGNLPADATFAVCDRTDGDKTKRITLRQMQNLDVNTLDPDDYWWFAKGTNSAGKNKTWRVNLEDMQEVIPKRPMISLTITPSNSTHDIDDVIELVAETTGGPADAYYWNEIDGQVFDIVDYDWESQTLKLTAKGTVTNSTVKCTATQYLDGYEETVSATATLSVTKDVLYPGNGGTPNNPISTMGFGYLYKGMAVKEGYEYILAFGGDGNWAQTLVFDNASGTGVNYRVQAGEYGGGFWFEGYFYRISKGQTSVKMKRHHDRLFSNTTWESNWTDTQTLSNAIAAQAHTSKYGVFVGKKNSPGAYYSMSPGNKIFNTRTFQGLPLGSKQIWAVCTSEDGTTVVTDDYGNVYTMDHPWSQETAKKTGTWHQGTYEDAGGVDVAFDNKGTWMVAKRRSYYSSNIGGGIMRSTDNGKTWTSLTHNLIKGEKHCSSIAYGDGAWVATFSEAPWTLGVCLVAKSTNNGDTWTSLYDNPRVSGQPSNYMAGVRYAGNGKWLIFRSEHPRDAIFF